MLEWGPILTVVSANWKRDLRKQIAHYFGHREIVQKKGRATKRDLIKLVQYIMQEYICTGCRVEFRYEVLTRDRTKLGARGGRDELTNVTLMCSDRNQAKGVPLQRLGMITRVIVP